MGKSPRDTLYNACIEEKYHKIIIEYNKLLIVHNIIYHRY